MATATRAGTDRDPEDRAAGDPSRPRQVVDFEGTGGRDQVASFRPAILGIRGGTTAVAVALASPSFADGDGWVIGWCGVVVAYNLFRIVRPVRYVDDAASIVGCSAR